MPIGQIAWNKGIPHSEETKRKISKAKIGKHLGYKPNLGKHFSEEAKRKMSGSHKGNKSHLGIFHTEETKRKISEALKGNTYSLGYHHTEETKQKMSKARKGCELSKEHKLNMSLSCREEKSYNWKGGITPLINKIRKCFEYRQWRSDVYTRDNFTCQGCGDDKGGNLEAHHIKSFSSIMQYYEIITLEGALECEELWNINNGITLCMKCHKKIRKGDNNG